MKKRHVMISYDNGRGPTFIFVQGRQQTANITVSYRSCHTVIIIALSVELDNADGKKIYDCVSVVYEAFSFNCSNVQQKDT